MMGMLTFEIVVVAMTTATGEVLRDSVVEPSDSPKIMYL